jgi:hypothetical protein
MAPTSSLADDVRHWFERGDEAALTRIYSALWSALRASSPVVNVLGQGAVEEVRQDVLVRLLDRRAGRLRDAEHPIAYARASFSRALTDKLRIWGPRARRRIDVDVIGALPIAAPQTAVETSLTAERAIEIADELEGKGRLAILLTTRPDRIGEGEWAALVADHPPPPPPRPVDPLDREEASALLFPPSGLETKEARRQRLNSFDAAYRRAAGRIRERLERR